MPASVSRFATDFKSGWLDRAKVLSDWATLTDKQFRAKYHVDPDTAAKTLGTRPYGPKRFRTVYGNDPQALKDYETLGKCDFEAKYHVGLSTAAAVFGPRATYRHGGKRHEKKKPKEKPTWLELQRAAAASRAKELAAVRAAQAKAYGEKEYDLGNAVRAIGL
jgi:hypothetical protein